MACPSFFKASYSAGVRIAATEPVTPSRMLAMCALLVQPFHAFQQTNGEVSAGEALILSAERPQVSPEGGAFQGVRHHQVCSGLAARTFRDVQQLLVAAADLELELDQ